jgi:hypothetical protein
MGGDAPSFVQSTTQRALVAAKVKTLVASQWVSLRWHRYLLFGLCLLWASCALGYVHTGIPMWLLTKLQDASGRCSDTDCG